MTKFRQTGVFPVYAVISALVLLAGILGALLLRSDKAPSSSGSRLVFFCAAGMRLPIEAILAEYEKECDVRVEVQYGGSNTLLSQLQVSRAADVYLAADEYYTQLAREKGLIRETIPVATMAPVIVVQPGNPKGIASIDDLLGNDTSVVLGNPGQAAIGKMTRDVLRQSGQWDALERHVTERGVFKPTVPDVANAVKIGSVDAGIVWSATAAQYPDLDVVRTPELDRGTSSITVAVTPWTAHAPTALGLARYIAGGDRGLPVFGRMGYEPADGDPWTPLPEITFFAGSVNRRAVEPIVRRFEQREGVRVNTVYNGCGILTAQMRAIRDDEGPDFPDTYIACDQYYLDTVAELFDEGVQVSDSEIVMVVAEGNPKQLRKLRDLTRPGIRVAIGQPDQCTIGVLSRRLLQDAGLYDAVLASNVVTQTATSAMLVPAVTTRAADVALAYRTDTLAEEARIDVVAVDSPLARAVQPFAVARSTEHKHLARRLLDAVRQSRTDFESAGFHWRLEDAPSSGGTAREEQ